MMMLTILMSRPEDIPLWGGVIVAIIFIYYKVKSGLKGNPSEKNTVRPNNKPTQEKANDKIIVVSNVDTEQLKIIIQQFCNLYNRDYFEVLPKLVIGEGIFIITFPYDISFMHLCFFINYLVYPHAANEFADYKPNVKGWCKTKEDEGWITEEIALKNVMLFIDETDEYKDNVYITTTEGWSFKIDFSYEGLSSSYPTPILPYESRPADLEYITGKETVLFE